MSRLRALVMRRVGGTGAPHHTSRSDAVKSVTKSAQGLCKSCAPCFFSLYPFVLSVGRLEIKSVEANASQVRHEILLFRFLIVLWYNGHK